MADSDRELLEWTSEREKELQAMRQLIASFERARSHAINEVARAAGVGLDMAAIMIDKADAIRDALKPFDSGIRARDAASIGKEGKD